MKVLWLVNMPPNVFSLKRLHRGQNYQGWIAGLAGAIAAHYPEMELTIAFESDKNEVETVDGITYCAFSTDSRGLRHAIQPLVRKLNPDIVHLHGSEGKFPALPTDAWCGKHVCMSLQGIINGYYPHYMGGLLSSELRKYSYAIRHFVLPFFGMKCHSTLDDAELWRTERSPSERKAFLHVENVLGRTFWDRAWTTYLNPGARYFQVGEVLRRPFYRGRRKAETVTSHMIYASACLTYPLKGGHWLLQAVAALKRKYPDVTLCIADSAGIAWPQQRLRHYFHSDYTVYLRSIVRRLGIEDNLILCPPLDAEAVAEKLSHAEVFCLPSAVENSPNSLGEAAMLGVPIVATDVGGVSSLVEHKREALLVPSSDPAVLAAAIDLLFSDCDMARTMADAAYQRAIRQYDPGIVAKQTFDAYSQICAR